MSTASFTFWDVQHGNACYFRTPNGQHIVVDLGIGDVSDENEAFSPLLHLSEHHSVKQLDAVIITHPHADHLGDILHFDEFRPRVLHRPKHLAEQEIRAGNRDSDSELIDKYLEVNSRYNYLLRSKRIRSEQKLMGESRFNTFTQHHVLDRTSIIKAS